jgi:hypothetical protein
VVSKVLEFAANTKLFGIAANPQGTQRLQKDLMNLCNWSKDWQMLFNFEQCKVMHVGYNNENKL